MVTPNTRLAVLAFIFAALAIAVGAANRRRLGEHIAPKWTAIPYQLNEWTGNDGAFDSAYGSDPADSSLLRIYTNSSTEPIIAYVGFYHNLAKYMEFHNPEICYPAQGWTLLSSGQAADSIHSRGEFRPEIAVVEKNGQRRLVVWWYYAGARAFENRIRYAAAVLALASLGGRRDGAMVRLETRVSGSEEAAMSRLRDFEARFLPNLDQTLPR